MEKVFALFYQSLQKLIGLHRQLLDLTRAEREAFVQADLKEIQNFTLKKQELIKAVYQAESERSKLTREIAKLLKKEEQEINLSKLVMLVQTFDIQWADQFRSAQNVLGILIQRIQEQNSESQQLIEKSLEHIHAMKKNALGEMDQKNSLYTQQGQKKPNQSNHHFISKEA